MAFLSAETTVARALVAPPEVPGRPAQRVAPRLRHDREGPAVPGRSRQDGRHGHRADARRGRADDRAWHRQYAARGARPGPGKVLGNLLRVVGCIGGRHRRVPDFREETMETAACRLAAAMVVAGCDRHTRDQPCATGVERSRHGGAGRRPCLQPRLSRRRPEPLGEARHQGEDRADFRHRGDELGDRRQHRLHPVVGQRGDARRGARPAPARHRRHHQPAERADRAAQGNGGGGRLRSQGAARQARAGVARPHHRGRRGQFRDPCLSALHRDARGLRSRRKSASR